MSGQIFISYRRKDSAASAGRLYDRLSGRFRSNRIFFDVDNIPPGVDFVETIEQSVGSCDVLIAVIGKRWLISSEGEGSRRLDNPDDFVRLEIATALKRSIRVIPVLVDDASMPRASDLPDDLKTLVRRNAVEVRQDRFRSDSESLITTVDQALKEARAERRKRGFTPPGKGLSIAGAVTVLALVTVASIYFTSHPLNPTTPEVQLQQSAEQSPAIVATPPTPSEEPARKFQQTPAPVPQEPLPSSPDMKPSSPDMKKLLDVFDKNNGSSAAMMAQLLRPAKRPAADEKVIGQPASPDIRATIRKNYDRLSEAVAKKDIQAFKAVYSADFVVRDGAEVRNAETYFSQLEAVFSMYLTASYDIQDVVMTAPDTAVVTVKCDAKPVLMNHIEKDRDTWRQIVNQWLITESNVLESSWN
jgi:hypothetical protein